MLAADVAQALMLLVELFQGHCSFMLAANLSTRLRLVMQTFLMPGALYHDPHVAEVCCKPGKRGCLNIRQESFSYARFATAVLLQQALTALLPLVACGGHLGTDTDVKRLYDMLLAVSSKETGRGRFCLIETLTRKPHTGCANAFLFC